MYCEHRKRKQNVRNVRNDKSRMSLGELNGSKIRPLFCVLDSARRQHASELEGRSKQDSVWRFDFGKQQTHAMEGLKS